MDYWKSFTGEQVLAWAGIARRFDGHYRTMRKLGLVKGACFAAAMKGHAIRRMRQAAAEHNSLA